MVRIFWKLYGRSGDVFLYFCVISERGDEYGIIGDIFIGDVFFMYK